jgi:hypothetical protein
MTACAQCNAEVAPAEMFFTPSGAQVCKRCHFAGQTSEMDARARAVAGAGATARFEQDSPTKMMLRGAGVFGLGVAVIVVGLVGAGRFYVYPLLLLGVGFVMFARGLHLRPRRHRR